ncbi:hypothetical protein PIB30_119127 [Stylosanthes scabra]|nr:hypothetical protein [Stylosanthes scabra]
MGRGYKCYINPHGKKFYSKLEVFRYLQTIKGNECDSRKEEPNTIHSPTDGVLEKPVAEASTAGKPGAEKSTSGKPGAKKSMAGKPQAEKSTAEKAGNEKSGAEKSTAEGLPPGWIIEAKERKGGKSNRKDLFYIDPESGYVFRSKKDVLRYLESGDISSCAIKPFKQEIQDEDNLSPTSTAKKQKIKQSGTKRELFAGKELSHESSFELPHANSSGKRQHVAHRSSPRLAAAEPDQLTNSLTREQCLEVPRRNLRRGGTVLDTDLANESSNPNKSSNKKKPLIPRRASKRLAGSEPELTSNSLSYERAPEYNKSKKSKSGININLLPCDGEAQVELVEHASVNGVSSSKGRKHPKTLAVNKDKLDKRENEEMNDEKSEPQQSLAFHYSWSDPSLEFAIQTLTGSLPAENSVGNRPTMTFETDKLSENDMSKNVTGSSSHKKAKVNSSKSKKKKDPKVPTRLSKRLAGHEPEVLPTETPPEYSTRKSGKKKTDANEILTNGATGQLHAGEEESNLTVNASDMLKTRKCGESLIGDELHKSQTVPNEQQGPEDESINERSEQKFPAQFGNSWSDPCLEFAYKSLTSSMNADAANVPVMAPDINDPPCAELLENAVQKSNNPAPDNNNHCQIKEVLNPPVSQSEQCLGQGQPELRSNHSSYQDDPAFASREPCGDEGKITRNSDEGQSVHVGAGNMTQIDINTLFFDDPFTEDEQILEDNSIAEQPQTGTEATNRDNSEREFCVSFMDTWSDPCLEFAFKTLTGDIPVEQNIPPGFQGHPKQNLPPGFQEPPKQNIPPGFGFQEPAKQNIPPGFQEPAKQNIPFGFQEPAKQNIPPGFQGPTKQNIPPGFGFQEPAKQNIPPGFQEPTKQNIAPGFGFQEPANCHDQRNGGSALPEIGSSSISQSHIAQRSMPTQPPSMNLFPSTQPPSMNLFPSTQLPSINSSILPQEKSNPPTGTDAQRHYSQYNINFQRR